MITSNGVDVRALEQALTARVDGEVRFDDTARAVYSTDASNYRQVPIGVVVPRSVDAAAEALRVCRDQAVPVLNRGGGTSLAGQCCNVAVVIDWSKYCTALVSLDVGSRRVIVEPGIVLDALNEQLAAHGLMFGPRPATHSHCTIGGMIGNNACGASAQAFGKTVDNVRALEIMTAGGERMWVGATTDEELERISAAGGPRARLYDGLRELSSEFADRVRSTYPEIPRRVSGYNLDSLLPENGFHLARALVGSESTLATILHAELDLVPVVPARTMVVLGYPTIADAADAAVRAAPFEPLTIEGLDRTLAERERAGGKNLDGLDLLPDAGGWLVIELGGADGRQSRRRADDLVAAMTAGAADGSASTPDSTPPAAPASEPDADSVPAVSPTPTPTVKVIEDQTGQQRILSVREAALGASAWHPDLPGAWPGWEDAAVPPERLGDYLRAFLGLLDEFGFEHVPLYGHFGHGCVHTRIPFELTTPAGVAVYESFLRRAAQLVVGYGGSLSGEHGDGQARSWLLPVMFGEEIVGAFSQLKMLFDPENRMNPGKVVSPSPATADLRLDGGDRQSSTTTAKSVTTRLHFSYPVEGGFDGAALRCVGIGNCRSHTGGVMCPSYRATGDEEHSTRGRARLLFEMVRGEHHEGPVTDGWRSNEVLEALDLCLACKGCLSDCPVDVDMATYKAEFLSHHYAGRVRPAAHYSMGWLPRWARVARLAPRAVNALTHLPGLAPVLKRLAGLDPRRPLPDFAPERFTDRFRRREPDGSGGPRPSSAPHGDVVLWPDTFTNNFHPGVARAAVSVLEHAGYRVIVPDGELCCGLTWISTGQLSTARHVLERTAAALRPLLEKGTPLVALEPSCTAVFRADAPRLCPDDADVALLTEHTRTLSELLLATPGWSPPSIARDAVVQPHCHQHAVMGFDPDAAILERAGVDATTVGGCCGLAGNFGFEAGHLDVSLACAAQELLPAIQSAPTGALIVADGFSCRTQIEQTSDGVRPIHLAELLAESLAPERPGPARRIGRRTLQQLRTAFSRD